MLWRHHFDALKREQKFSVERLLRPQCSIVVGYKDALFGRYELHVSGGGCVCYEVDDALLQRAIIPGRQWVCGRLRVERSGKHEEKKQGNGGFSLTNKRQ